MITARHALQKLCAGLNPARIMAASFALGLGRLALERAVEYANARNVWDETIDADHTIQHRLLRDRLNGWLCIITRGRHGYLVRLDDWNWTATTSRSYEISDGEEAGR